MITCARPHYRLLYNTTSYFRIRRNQNIGYAFNALKRNYYCYCYYTLVFSTIPCPYIITIKYNRINRYIILLWFVVSHVFRRSSYTFLLGRRYGKMCNLNTYQMLWIFTVAERWELFEIIDERVNAENTNHGGATTCREFFISRVLIYIFFFIRLS